MVVRVLPGVSMGELTVAGAEVGVEVGVGVVTVEEQHFVSNLV